MTDSKKHGPSFDKEAHIVATIADMARHGERPDQTIDDLVTLLRSYGLQTTAESAPRMAHTLLSRACERGAFAPELTLENPSLQHLLLEHAAKHEGDTAWLLSTAARMINALKARSDRYEAQVAVLQGRVTDGAPAKEA